MEETNSRLRLRSALSIDDIDHLHVPPNDGISIIWVDISERPDLEVLTVRRVQKPNDVESIWFFENPCRRNMFVGLQVALKQPAAIVFVLAFQVERLVGHLSMIAKYGKLWIVPGPPHAHLVGTQAMNAHTGIIPVSGQGVLIKLEAHQVTYLRARLDEWKRLT